MALPRGAMGLSAFVIVVFPGQTHLQFLNLPSDLMFQTKLYLNLTRGLGNKI